MLALCNCAEFKDSRDPCERPPNDRTQFRHYVKHGPVQPSSGFTSCGSDAGSKWRLFKPEWYTRFEWLEYSLQKQAAFCFFCRLFGVTNGEAAGPSGGQVSQAFSNTGYNNWKKALQKKSGFLQHAESKAHFHAEQAYRSFIAAKPVDAMLSDERERQLCQRQLAVQTNRSTLSRIFSAVRFLARVGLPFRGHDEQPSSLNRGVFLEMLSYLAESGDEVLASHLQSAAGNAKYTSPQIQNEMIALVGSAIQNVICDKVRQASVYAVLMDETTDVSHREQVAVFVRFVTLNDSAAPEIEERMLALVETRDVTGQGLTDLLLTTLEKHGLSVASIVGQGYDGGSNMMAACKGVQARISQLNPAALFTHCFCHSANRAVINAICNKDNRYARNFFGTVELLYAFIEGSALRHAYFVERQFQIAGTKFHLKGLSETRWNCRSASLQRLQQKGVLQAAVDTIEHVADTTSDGSTRGKAVGLLASIQKFEFIICLCSLSPVLSLLNSVSECLQQQNIDLLQAHNLITALKKEIQSMRTDQKWVETVDAATEIAHDLGIETQFQQERRKKVPRRILDDGETMEGTHFDPSDMLKIELYFNTIDCLSGQLTERFPQPLRDFAYLQPKHMQTIDGEVHIRTLAERYGDFGVDSDRAVSQWRLSRHLVTESATASPSLSDVFVKLPADFSDLRMLYKIAMTVPITTASVERGFSKLAYVKNKLRSTMTQDRLESLILATAEKDIMLQLSNEDLVAKFAGAADRRLDLG